MAAAATNGGGTLFVVVAGVLIARSLADGNVRPKRIEEQKTNATLPAAAPVLVNVRGTEYEGRGATMAEIDAAHDAINQAEPFRFRCIA